MDGWINRDIIKAYSISLEVRFARLAVMNQKGSAVFVREQMPG